MFPVERVPEKIGAYTVLKYVGRSGLADVYVARMDGPLGFNRVVTLKIVRYALEDDARLADELAREAAICARLNHPAVMRMFDFFEHDRKLVLVLEQAEGASLAKLVSHLARRKQKLADVAVLHIAVEIAQALAHAHASIDESGAPSPVIHRHVSPENVYVGWDGRIKLAGFGLGKIIGQTPDSIAGTVTGTPGYMAPEQARGERATAKSDVYGLGALMWSLYANAEPTSLADAVLPDPKALAPKAPDPKAIKANAPKRVEQLPSISTLRPDIPREIAAAIDAALEPSPDKRRITCHDIAQWAAKLFDRGQGGEKGREELRQRMLGLKSTRDAIDAPRAAPRATKQRTRRRQQVSTARASLRRSALVGSSYPAPPSSRSSRASELRGPNSEGPGSDYPRSDRPRSHGPRSDYPRSEGPRSHGPVSDRPRSRGPRSDAPSGVRIPPPPPLPKDEIPRGEKPSGSKPPMKSSAGFRTPTSPGMPRPQFTPLAETMRPALPVPAAPTRMRPPTPNTRMDSALARDVVVEEELADADLVDSSPDRESRLRRVDPELAPPPAALTVRPISVIPPASFSPDVHRRGPGSTRPHLDLAPPASEPAITPREADPVAHALRSRQAFEEALKREAQIAADEKRARATAKSLSLSDAPASTQAPPVFGPHPDERRLQPLGGEPLNEATPTSAELPARGGAAIDVRASGTNPRPLTTGAEDLEYRVRGRDSRYDRRSKSVWITVLTAALVAAVGVVILQKTWTSNAATGAPTATVAATSGPAPTAPQVGATPSAAPTATSVATATPSATTPTSGGPVPSGLGSDQGVLTVKGPDGYLVYVHGHGVGKTNEANVVPCGQRFLRLALPSSPKLPIWVGRGQTVITKCMGETTVQYDVGTEQTPTMTSPFDGTHRPGDRSPL